MFCPEYSMFMNKCEFICENMNKLQPQFFGSQYFPILLKIKPTDGNSSRLQKT